MFRNQQRLMSMRYTGYDNVSRYNIIILLEISHDKAADYVPAADFLFGYTKILTSRLANIFLKRRSDGVNER